MFYNSIKTSKVNHITLEYIAGLRILPGNILSILVAINVLSSSEEGTRNYSTKHRASKNPALDCLAARSRAAFLAAMIWLGCCGFGLSNIIMASREKKAEIKMDKVSF